VIARRGRVLLIRKQLIELGLVVKREPNLHLEWSIESRVAQRGESFSLGRMVSIQPYAVIGIAPIGQVTNYREAKRTEANSEGADPANSKKPTNRSFPPEPVHRTRR
jgi:hypothetical protein